MYCPQKCLFLQTLIFILLLTIFAIRKKHSINVIENCLGFKQVANQQCPIAKVNKLQKSVYHLNTRTFLTKRYIRPSTSISNWINFVSSISILQTLLQLCSINASTCVRVRVRVCVCVCVCVCLNAHPKRLPKKYQDTIFIIIVRCWQPERVSEWRKTKSRVY